MKKYLMTGIAAVAMCAAFTSCGNDEITQYTPEEIEAIEAQKIIQNYEQAFVKTFGQPNKNQDWGFSANRSAGVTRALPTFPTFKDNDCPSMPTIYSNTVPEDAIYAKTYAEEHPNDKYPVDAVIYINDAYPTLPDGNQPGNVEGLTIYVDGDITLDGGFYQNGKGTTLCVTENSTLKLGSVRDNLTIYLAPGATLDITEGMERNWSNGGKLEKNGNNTFIFSKENAKLYINSTSTVKATNVTFKDGYTVLNEGKIEAVNLNVENKGTLFNKNEIKATETITIWNAEGEIDNFNKIEAASLSMGAGARFYNVAGGEVKIDGLTKLDNDGGTNAWQNSGKYTTGSFEITGGCQDPAAFNDCNMTVNGKFFMNHGNFVLDGGASVVCESFEWESDNYFHMGGKALLKVDGEMLMNNINSDPKFGFWGDGSEYAVIQAGSIEKKMEGKYRAAYYGNIFVDTHNHFAQGRSSADGAWYYFDNTVKFSFTDANEEGAKKATDFSITIAKDEKGCTPGYSYITKKSANLRVIAEDLSVGDGDEDFDFNDVVFDVYYGDANTAKVTILAAGGTLDLKVNGVEVHELLGHPGKMINTNGTKNPSLASKSVDGVEEKDIQLGFAVNNALDAKEITIEVNKNGKWVVLTADRGKAASKVAVGTDYQWCNERTYIGDNFKQFVNGESTYDEWYKSNNK